MLANEGGDHVFLLAGEVARVGDEDVEPGGQEDVVQRLQVVGEDAVGERPVRGSAVRRRGLGRSRPGDRVFGHRSGPGTA